MKSIKIRKIKSFTIDRLRWIRGDEKYSSLLRSDDRMCCLGFYLKACGMPKSCLLDEPTPGGLLDNVKFRSWLIGVSGDYKSDSQDCQALMHANDRTDDEEREKDIARIFARHRVKVRFVH